MTTNALLGYGQTLELAYASAPTVFTQIREIFNATPPNRSRETVQVTHFQSPNRKHEKIPGIGDSGAASYEMNYIPGSATDAYLRAADGFSMVARHTWPNGFQMLYSCSISAYEPDGPLDDRMVASLELEVSGDPYMSASATSPRNLVLPTISGTPQVGQLLTVDPGEWAGVNAIAFQWQADTAGNGTFVDIAGATASTFVPTASQEGDDIRCEVTGTNPSLSTVANSAETATVAAA